MLLDSTGKLIAKASSAPYPLHSKQGSATQNPDDIWRGARVALRDLVQQCETVNNIAGICLSGAMHSVVGLNREGLPTAPAITWVDQRPAALVPQLQTELGNDRAALYARTGCPLQTPYHLPRLRWWQQEHGPATLYVSLKDWVFWQLTGEFWTDVGLASTTGLVDIHSFTWDKTALAHAHISPTNLPQLKAPTDTSMLAAEVAQDIGLPSIPVILGGSDGALANLGSSAGLPQRAAVTVGTSGAVRLLSTTPLLDDADKARTWCYVLTEGRYVAGGAINNGGIALQYLREKLFPECSTTQLINEATEINLHTRRPLVLPYLSGERSPHWRSDATATIHGLTLEQGRGALVRSVLEAVCFCLADIWQILRPQTDTDTVYLSGGICKSQFWSQILADVFGVDIVMLDAADASAVGAAMLGHHALGTADLAGLSDALPVGERLRPNADAHKYYLEKLSAFRGLFEQLYKSFPHEKI